ncbi:MAG: GlxA family transcriptional regulator [Halofilum sp. (in: g-proteobacteria)]|nr:GlxA family transcriptional regulator [Halofilum sp. (in: g-proteobacteria)]
METAPDTPAPRTRHLGLLLVPDFPLMAFSSAIEPLRAANLISGTPLYRWHLLSCDGNPVQASSGIGVLPDGGLESAPALDTVYVCGGLRPQGFDDPRALAWLRDRAQSGTAIGALSTGTFVLARAGLLDGYRCTTHWEALPALTEAFPELEVSGSLFEIDRDRATSAGGTAAMDLMLHLIAREHGNELAEAVSNNFIHGRIRASADRQPMSEQIRLRARAPKLAAAIDLMQGHVEQPLSTAAIAARIGVSRRQLERLFQHHRGCTPRDYYMRLRLEHARVLLLETGLSILNVALASGFVSQSHFGACYRQYFGHTPGAERSHARHEPADAPRADHTA